MTLTDEQLRTLKEIGENTVIWGGLFTLSCLFGEHMAMGWLMVCTGYLMISRRRK